MASPTIILASSSPYKRAQLEQICTRFSWQSPNIAEAALKGETACKMSLRLAEQKAQAIAKSTAQAEQIKSLIIGCDQSAELNGNILTKPDTHARAEAQLLACSAKTICFYSAVAVCYDASQAAITHVTTTHVTFRTLTVKEIRQYLLHDKPYDCAGSFKVEAKGICLFEKVQSDDPSALIGLPLIGLNNLLLNLGVNILL